MNKRNRFYHILRILIYISLSIIMFISLSFLFVNIYQVIRLELLPTYTWDSPIYWAVGRGMLNGIQPYSGLFETKPPGIFYVSTLSFWLVDEITIGNVINALCLLVLGLTPFIFTMMYYRKSRNFMKVILLFIGLVCGASIMFYTSLRSGKYQVESYGAGFASLYLLMISLMDTKKLRFYSLSVILSGLFAMISVMFKEPFLIVMIASSFILIHSMKDLKYKLILPLLYGGVFGVILLAITNCLIPYMTIYLKHMLMGHIQVYGPLSERAFKFGNLIGDLQKYSEGFFNLLIALAIFYFVSCLLKFLKIKDVKWRDYMMVTVNMIKLPIGICLVMLTIALGGQFYNHHYAFAAPLYIALSIFLIQEIVNIRYRYVRQLILAVSFVLCILNVYHVENSVLTFPEDVLAYNTDMREQAIYVDTVLDELEIDQYLQLGFNQVNKFYGLTKHSPLGPAFFQDSLNFIEEDSWFSLSFKEQLEQAKIVILDRKYSYDVRSLNAYTDAYLNTHFSKEIPNRIKDIEIPDSFKVRYRILYRIEN